MTSSTTRVMPYSSDATGIPLSALKPDLNNDGDVEPWEHEVYQRITAADTDNTGTISVRNLFDFIRSMSNEVKEAANGAIPISTLNPDTDGDGKVEKWEVDVFKRIQSADEDKSGSISVKELFGVIKGAAESDKQKKLFARMLGVAVVIIFALIGAMLAMSMIAGEAIKESHISGQAMTTPSGQAVQMEPSNSHLTLWELPTAPMEVLARMASITFYANMANGPVGGWVEATFKVSGAYKLSNDVVFFSTPEGHVVRLDHTAESGDITMANGLVHAISEQTPPERRHLAVESPAPRLKTTEQLKEVHRRRLGFFTALMTSGNFMMMQAAAF